MGAISRVFKGATRAVKKVTSGVTKAAKKIGKGIAKIGKSVWNGVKKLGGAAFKAYGKISGKLGPIGMIGLSMAMPYLMPGFTGAAGGLWTNFGAKATTWANHATNPFLRTMGQIGGNIYKGTNFIKGTAQGISQTIGKTFEGFASEGTFGSRISSGFSNLYKGTTEVLTGKAGKGTMIPTQFKEALGTTVNKNLLNVKPAFESSQFAAFNPNTLVQTGGIELGNMNIANKFTYDVTSAAMKNAGVFNNFTEESTKYLNTLRKVGVDDNTAYQYLTKNGVNNGVLDKSLSADFMQVGNPMGEAFQFTGDNLRSSFKAADYNYNMKFTKPKVEGDVFAQPDSLLKPQGIDKPNSFKQAALSTALSGQNSSDDGAVKFASLKATDPNSMITGTGGTSGAYTKEGGLLTKAQLAFFANQNLDIA
tara:strand:- start:1319 stop:2581 length:1263 start_codon:yes stop_codon:yes gene_type:complete